MYMLKALVSQPRPTTTTTTVSSPAVPFPAPLGASPAPHGAGAGLPGHRHGSWEGKGEAERKGQEDRKREGGRSKGQLGGKSGVLVRWDGRWCRVTLNLPTEGQWWHLCPLPPPLRLQCGTVFASRTSSQEWHSDGFVVLGASGGGLRRGMGEELNRFC